MTKTIQSKVILNLLVVLSVVMLLFLGLVYRLTSGYVTRYHEEMAELGSKRVASLIAKPMQEGDVARAERLMGVETLNERVYAVIIKSAHDDSVFAGAIGNNNDDGWSPVKAQDEYMKANVSLTKPIVHDGVQIGTVMYYRAFNETTKKIRIIFILVSIVTISLMGTLLIALIFTLRKVVIRPLKRLSEGMENIAQGEGDLTVRISMDSEDEIGALANNFNIFTSNIQIVVSQVKEVSQTLSTFTSQISATASELSASATETSSTLHQVTTTAEEIKQTSLVSNQKAEGVAQKADQAAKISKEGENASREAMEGMKRIKEEMEYIAESIVKLSEHSQSIGDIIGAVNDLANESNLLSVNASIEAAKAGEYGKGFGVVAQEVKSLSDQSKQATGQVKAILNDIQDSTSKAVMAMERGTKAVDSGEQLSSSSGNAIRVLTQRVEESAQSATQISASSQQQLMGLDQLTAAMESIKLASTQNADGSQQLEQATAQLDEISQTLQHLAGKFKVD